ncbi:mannose-1-phosphate guanylyltransferase/mannose-6-phosphate isomerase [Asticcacaulis excentricus]|uniref:mannose-1-phosphate guanylyltransferase n=1 Tax=Asticcacaulis excentricus (strain ATCC 15261 / DSM 4724 / KCTC 12464 / NCIMB 9791 / VKM B-1370 / CB 48) TaxID=573065 RepID=E8RMD1_ASTEC|nr:mannose-1-phosphate guanylyltransferase/mannose-6-phosphate isomerase [Asticcacaulis excentricus]ADU13882.1 Mannose-1-phosphate guanylyltransferase [Asticcacaulis excentricus CB 48]
MKILPVIMSGGSGTRLWPLSTPEQPKQFHALATQHTMIQETALRLSGAEFLKPVVICGKSHEALAVAQLGAIDFSPQAVVLEPFARNTAAVAAVAALIGEQIDPQALVLMVPADHMITKPEAFRDAISKAAPVAKDRIVTFGITPTAPETGFGYIQRGEELADGVYGIKRFLEKPNFETAQSYLADGGYDWNAGIFLFAPKVMIEELGVHEPGVLTATKAAFETAEVEGVTHLLNADAFANCPSISVDYAVMERTQRAATAPCDIGWADVGGFSELWRLGAKDGGGNHAQGSAILIDANNCLVRAEGPPVAIIGLDNIMVVSTPSGIVVAPISRAQDVKLAAEAAKKLQEIRNIEAAE